jgi:hypothetical protein
MLHVWQLLLAPMRQAAVDKRLLLAITNLLACMYTEYYAVPMLAQAN